MLHGYNNKLLRVNLSNKKVSTEDLGEKFCRFYLGGAGFVAYYLLKELQQGVEALGPDNKLIFALGPVTGVALSGTSRNSIGTKSPLTGGIVLSEVGEAWGAELKYAGYDMLIIEGKSEKPIYLWIHDGDVELMDGAQLWGKETKETQQLIREDIGDKKIRVASIGPAGEHLVKYACIMNGLYDAAGRGGAGAVMGSKNLKAIAVRGSYYTQVADEKKVKELTKWFAANIENMPVVPVVRKYGTGAGYKANVESGNVPVNNFLDGILSYPDALDAVTIKNSVRIGMRRCQGCLVGCKKVVQFDEPYSCDPAYGGPEYEALAALGSNCGIENLKVVCKANELCNALSLDTISTGVVISFIMECYENNLISLKETGGIDLRFGNEKALLEIIPLIAYRKGIGNLLADGTAQAAKHIGQNANEYAINVKGLEIPMHDPRLKPGLGLGYMVNPHGADHCCNIQDALFTGGPMLDDYIPIGYGEPLVIDEIGPKKVSLFRIEQLIRVIRDCMLMCWFCTWSPTQLAEIINAVTGWNTTIMELIRVAERVLTMARLFNLREGLSSLDDKLPSRFFQPKASGALSKKALEFQQMEDAKRYYYILMGWDEKTGIPLPEKIEELGLSWVKVI